MAINENFVFTDAVPAQQAVSMAQIAAAEDAARRQMMSETLRSLTAAQVARENSAQQRYLTQSQIAQQGKALAQREGESIRMADIYKQQIGAQTKQTVDRERENRAKIQLDTLRNALTVNPPSPKKFRLAMTNPSLVLNDDEKKQIESEWALVRSQAEKNYNMSAGIANAIQAKLDRLKPDDTAGRQQEINDAEKRYKGLIVFNPGTGRMMSVFPQPEMDDETAPPPPAVPPQAAGGMAPVTQLKASLLAPAILAPFKHLLQRSIGGLGGRNTPPVSPPAQSDGQTPFYPSQTFVPQPQAAMDMSTLSAQPVRPPIGYIPEPEPQPVMPVNRAVIPPADTSIPLDERFDEPVYGFTGMDKFINRGVRLTEMRPDAAARRFEAAKKMYPNAQIYERGGRYFIIPEPPQPPPRPEWIGNDFSPQTVLPRRYYEPALR